MVAEEPLSDGMLLAALQAGEGEAYVELVKRYERPLWRVARSRLGRDDWAEDAVQETFLCVVRWLHTYDSRYSFRTWLWTILLNQCHRQLKRSSRGLWASVSPEEVAAAAELPAEIARQLRAEDSPAQRLLAKERGELLDALLRQLPEVQADALRLRFFGGLQFNEIAAAMECSLSTAKNRVKWGLLKLAEYLGPDGKFASWGQALGDSSHADHA